MSSLVYFLRRRVYIISVFEYFLQMINIHIISCQIIFRKHGGKRVVLSRLFDNVDLLIYYTIEKKLQVYFLVYFHS